MPRQARNKGEYSIYHIIQRGNERKNIFGAHEDKNRFLDTLKRMKDKYNFVVHAYCVMDNHVHLIINDNGNDISKIVKSINISYAYYYNYVYDRCGHLFQDRFRSELITDDNYFLQASKYIHNNPVKAGMVRSAEEYKWSSYNIYTGRAKDIHDIVETDKVLGIISNNRSAAIKEYMRYVVEAEQDVSCIDIEEDNIILIKGKNPEFVFNIEQAEERLKKIAESLNQTVEDVKLNIKLRDEAIRDIRKNSSLSLKQIGELFGGISESRVSRILKKEQVGDGS